jgi:cysteine desulfurase
MAIAYLDCNATTPMEPEVLEVVQRFMQDEYGNAGSRTHQFGARAKRAVQEARSTIADLLAARPEEVLFTSGATESNNLALLGLERHAREIGRRHFVSTLIEHKAVLEPLEVLANRGFEITLVEPTEGGWVEPDAVRDALRPDTVAISVMHVNNETGVIQPIQEICAAVEDHDAYLHVDAAQGFGKCIEDLRNPRIDLVSLSGHKIYGPKGIGALMGRRRGFDAVPLTPLQFGGGQERTLRPGTLPVPLVVGLGKASELAAANYAERDKANCAIRDRMFAALRAISPMINGDPERTAPHCVNVSFKGVDSEAAIVALKEIAAISNGSACTSQSYSPSHVLSAMGLNNERIAGALRISWCHLTDEPDWNRVAEALSGLQ